MSDIFGKPYGEMDAAADGLMSLSALKPAEDPDAAETADMRALIDYVTTLSKIHKKRISIFTIPERGAEERFTRCEIGFGPGTKILSGYGEDLHPRRKEDGGVL